MQGLRQLSQIFTAPMFAKIVRDNDTELFLKKIIKYYPIDCFCDNLSLIQGLYKYLMENYRCEYIYKNKLFLDIIRNHRLKETVVLNEFKIANSKADLVMLNGSIRIFEIKTELDDLSKLSKQIEDYQKVATEVTIVTNENNIDKLEPYANRDIGIVVLDQKHKLEEIKKANYNNSFLSFDALFRVLRKQEYLDMVLNNFGYIPNVPNMRIFRVCYELLSKLKVEDFQKQVLEILKKRELQSRNLKLLRSSRTPRELKYMCNTLNFNANEYDRLHLFLSREIVCTNHI
ncbi:MULTISPECIES: sce7726 family protein [unclassified Lonepinella]|uniref:sce7726 family protein n=1 Tax=unclassified Lonepinella TaxID=2642006 RepID=UPI0036DBA9D9